MKGLEARKRLLGGASAIAAALSLSACMPMDYYGPQYAGPGPVAPSWADMTGFEDYEWIDRADAMSEAIGESPPDYSFQAAESAPWAWMLEDGSLVLAEQREDGLHSYFFEANSDVPFLVRDPDMSYGFIEGRVAVVYGPEGDVLSREEATQWLRIAIEGFDRGRMLKRAMLRRDQWQPVRVSTWIDFSYLWWDWQLDWSDGQRRNERWRHHRNGPRGGEYRRRLDPERRIREIVRDRFNRWGDGGWQGAPPG
ncbi:hypothetical protein P1X14_16965, partial [Sphingomonas sp. AOB5]|uniref:hypothetical protein n=1 Tax=Sphingomonas sp. AOB5 TaxID=3034017 RepID=UPI0023F80835